jgi:hypothetical protein
MTSDDNNKPISLKDFARQRATKVHDDAYARFREAMWQDLCALWIRYAEGTETLPAAGKLQRSAEPEAVFGNLLGHLISLAQASGVDNEEVMDCLLIEALSQCEPKGRLRHLLHKASNLLENGDEDSWEKGLRAAHAAGNLTDEELAQELALIGVMP